ncbi:MAG: DsbC family protein [Thioalkalivibrio sp.]|nr:MAG: DsbC family protein [Thioalkalivibrio sp.]
MLMIRTILIALMTTLAITPALATDAIERRLAEVVPTVSPDSIEPSGIPGVYEVRFGTDILYVSEDGRYLLQGSLIDLDTRENLTDKSLRSVRAEIFEGIPDDELTVYVPEGEVRHVINVFTDPNCPFCRQMHEDMQAYLDAGVKVRYLMYPVLGRESPTIMRDIWCADSRTDAMDRAKAGRSVPSADCPTPSERHLALGQELGISGTPATISDGGQLISGFRPAVEVIQALEAE